jgi:hypothetical protein
VLRRRISVTRVQEPILARSNMQLKSWAAGTYFLIFWPDFFTPNCQLFAPRSRIWGYWGPCHVTVLAIYSPSGRSTTSAATALAVSVSQEGLPHAQGLYRRRCHVCPKRGYRATVRSTEVWNGVGIHILPHKSDFRRPKGPVHCISSSQDHAKRGIMFRPSASKT